MANHLSNKHKNPLLASRILAEYEQLNFDLDPSTRRQLAVFALAPQVGVAALEALFNRPLGTTPNRHRSWFWYNIMRLSGLECHWTHFRDLHNSGVCVHHCVLWLRSVATDEQWLTLTRRYGVPRLSPYRWRHEEHKPRMKHWTAGGVWDKRNGFTKVIVLGESLNRTFWSHKWAQKISVNELRLLERELHARFDPEKMLVPQIMHEATAYVRHRIPQILGHKLPRTTYHFVSWFFQAFVPHPEGGVVHWRDWNMKHVRRAQMADINWLPRIPK